MRHLHIRLAAALARALVLVLLAAAPSQADVVTWVLSGVTFADGGTASGFFKYEASTSTVLNWSINVSGGNTGSFPPTTYNPSTSTVFVGTAGNPEATLFFTLNSPPDRQLRVTPADPLTDEGGSAGLELSTMSGQQGNIECFNCSPWRFITAGNLVSQATIAAIPAPPLDSRGIAALVLVLLLIAGRHIRSAGFGPVT